MKKQRKKDLDKNTKKIKRLEKKETLGKDKKNEKIIDREYLIKKIDKNLPDSKSEKRKKEKEKLGSKTTRANKKRKSKNLKDSRDRKNKKFFASNFSKYMAKSKMEDEELDIGIEATSKSARGTRKTVSSTKKGIRSLGNLIKSDKKLKTIKKGTGKIGRKAKGSISYYASSSFNENIDSQNETDDISSSSVAEINRARASAKRYGRIRAGKIKARRFGITRKARNKVVSSAKVVGGKITSAISSKVLIIMVVALIIPIILSSLFAGLGGVEETQQVLSGELVLENELPASVKHWEDDIKAELKKYNLEKYTDLLLVITKIESNGRGIDIMQSSESAGLSPNSLNTTKESIKLGVKHLKDILDKTNESGTDEKTLIQAYNYGSHFVDYVASNGGKWTQELSNSFSDRQASKLGWSSYGDKKYVSKAMKYLSIEDKEIILDEEVVATGKFAWPVPNFRSLSSDYGYRIHPIYGTKKLHTGIDIPAPTGTPIVSADNGVVKEANMKGGYGNTVVIDHGNGITTLYAHNSRLSVKVGQRVKKGDMIARAGSTGNSTGPHCHFEVRKNNNYTDPKKWLY